MALTEATDPTEMLALQDVYKHTKDRGVYARIDALPGDGAILFSLWQNSAPGWQGGAALEDEAAFRALYPVKVGEEGEVPPPLTNPSAAADFIEAYARHFHCSDKYAAQLLGELLDKRSMEDSATILALMSGEPDIQVASGLYTAALTINPFQPDIR